ncbi:MAG: TetR/AcrR family transcriptional regulator [Pseudomonadota bacterium]
MPDKRDRKKSELKARLLDAARETIARDGLDALRARDLAERVGCATGTVYNLFNDLDDLILHANAETMRQLGTALSAATAETDPPETFEALALAYARFARENLGLWNALFEHRMADGGRSPDWFLEGHMILLDRVIDPLAHLDPSLSEEALKLRARTYFAAVHGIVSITLQDRFLGLPKDALGSELREFVAQLTFSLATRPT